MKPQVVIGWAVLAAIAAGVGLFGIRLIGGTTLPDQGSGSPAAPVSAVAPPYSVYVVSVDCINRARDRAVVTVDNNGGDIPYAKAYVEFIGETGAVLSSGDSYFSPSSIPRGARASATIYSAGSGAKHCRLVRIQDGDGHRVKIL